MWILKSSFWRMFARPTSAKAISAPSSPQRCARPNACKALARRYGGGELIGYMAQVMDYSERLMRATLMDLPDGEGAFEDFCDGDGIADDEFGNDAPFRIRLSIKKTADRLIVDFAGTDAQVKGPMNAPLSVTASGVFCGLKTAVDPNNLIPPNSGCWRTIEIRARKGSVVNAAVSCPGRLCEPRDLASCGRHGDGRARELHAGAGDGLQPGHFGHPDAGRRRSPHRPALCVLRDGEGRLWGTAEQGWHQLHRQRHLQYDEHAGGNHGDGVSGAHRAL